MTNFEKFKSEILEAISKSPKIALKNNKPVPCNTAIDCKECDLDCYSCYQDLYRWLYEEYKEPPRIDLPRDIKIDTPILVSHDGETWTRRYFAGFDEGFEQSHIFAWMHGLTSWTAAEHQDNKQVWYYAKLPDEVK